MTEPTLNQIWWLNAKWPLTSNEQITTDHLEDLRKMCFALAYPECGRVDYGHVMGYDADDLSKETVILGEIGVTEIPAENCVVGELFIKTSKTKKWVLAEEVSAGCWRTYPDIDGTVYEALIDLGGEGETANTTVPSSSANWQEIETPALIFVNSSAKNFSGITEFTSENFDMPDVHPAYGVWMEGTPFESNGWALTADRNKYHTWDYNSPYKRCETLSYDSEDYVYKVPAHMFLPLQVDAFERNAPAVYQGDHGTWLGRDYRFRKTPDKQSWAKNSVTMPDRLGPYFTTQKDRQETAFANNQYWSDEVWPYPTGTPFYCDKVCDSLQAMVEFLVSNKKFCWPVNQTYIDNWEDAHPGTSWNLGLTGCTEYPSLSDEYWGFNGSPFEFLLNELGETSFDWWFDTSLKYIPDTVLQYQADESLSDSAMGFSEMKGTWRRTSKYSMDRVSKKYMRSNAMGAPTGDTYSVCHWSGLYVSTMPGRDEFDTTTGVAVSAKTDYSITISDTYDSDLKIGDMIRLYHEADAIDDDVMVWIIDKEIDGSNLILKVSEDISAISGTSLLIGFNADISDRHDAVIVEYKPSDSTPYPKFKLQWQMLQDLYDLILLPKYIQLRVGLSKKGKTIARGWDSSPGTETLGTGISYLAPKMQEIQDEFDSISVEDNVDPGDDWMSYTDISAYWTGVDYHIWEYNGEEYVWARFWGPNDVSESRAAIKVTQSSGFEIDFTNYQYLKDNSSIIIPVSYNDRSRTEDLTPDYYTPLFGGTDESDYYLPFREQNQASTVGGLSQELVAYTPTPPEHYGTVSLSNTDDDGWYILKGTIPSIIESAPYRIFGGFYLNPTNLTNTEYYWAIGGNCAMYLNFYAPYIVLQLDFNKIPESVFIEDGGRDRIGSIEPTGTPVADTNPPQSSPSQINEKPYLQWEYNETSETYELYIIVKASPAEDLEGSSPLAYKCLLEYVSGDEATTVPEDTYGTSNICVLKLLEVDEADTIGTKYEYSGTPTDVYDGAAIIAHRYSINHNGTIHTGDKLYFKYGGSPSDIEVTVTNVNSSSSFDIEASEEAVSTILDIWDVSGYNTGDWLADPLSNYIVKVRCKDSADNECNSSDGLAIIYDIDKWPIDLYIEREFAGSRDWYLSQLE